RRGRGRGEGARDRAGAGRNDPCRRARHRRRRRGGPAGPAQALGRRGGGGRHRQVLSGPDIVNRGFLFDETSGDILEEARERVMLSLKDSAEAEVVDRGVLEQNIRRVLGKYFYEVTERKPVILPVIVEV